MDDDAPTPIVPYATPRAQRGQRWLWSFLALIAVLWVLVLVGEWFGISLGDYLWQ